MGSLYLQKKTLISCSRICGCRCTIRLMLRRATYCISGAALSRVTSGGASLRRSPRRKASSSMADMQFRTTLAALMTTAAFACCRRGVTRSTTPCACAASAGAYRARASRMYTWPHSVHSFSAASSFCSTPVVTCSTSWPEASATSASAATALATTVGFASHSRSRSTSRNPRSRTRVGARSKSLATHTAAVLRTYGSSSRRARLSGSQRYSVIFSTRTQPIVRTASARTSGFGSDASFTKVLTAINVRSG
mmetsp:Transcript_16996/g.27618  ORF Transcript_16996/g.27618 Transcript_16996/m.27618 type:complete len:251 (-) Transcript_16996:397-1149(-)